MADQSPAPGTSVGNSAEQGAGTPSPESFHGVQFTSPMIAPARQRDEIFGESCGNSSTASGSGGWTPEAATELRWRCSHSPQLQRGAGADRDGAGDKAGCRLLQCSYRLHGMQLLNLQAGEGDLPSPPTSFSWCFISRVFLLWTLETLR
jgi:hypothetical protein